MPKAKPRDDPGVAIAVAAAGSFAKLARQLGISAAAVIQWKKVPVRHALTIEKLYKIPCYELRPDVWEPPHRGRPRNS
jgi:DNA-binding transcriptional regulator YdaS (Cro superfamily)